MIQLLGNFSIFVFWLSQLMGINLWSTFLFLLLNSKKLDWGLLIHQIDLQVVTPWVLSRDYCNQSWLDSWLVGKKCWPGYQEILLHHYIYHKPVTWTGQVILPCWTSISTSVKLRGCIWYSCFFGLRTRTLLWPHQTPRGWEKNNSKGPGVGVFLVLLSFLPQDVKGNCPATDPFKLFPTQLV